MNWYILAALLIIYPLFGLGIRYFSNHLFKTTNVSRTAFAPALISFVMGIGFLIYAIIFGSN